MALTVTSTAFEDGGMIPVRHTCDGDDLSPPLGWSGIPEGTRSLALICDDPDAPMGTWVHWVVFSMPPEAGGLSEGVPPERDLRDGTRQGMNDFRKIGYGGPCPPGGTHRYFFTLYALDVPVALESGATKAELLKAVEGHVLARGRLMGRYSR